jgi:hypothetical protein
LRWRSRLDSCRAVGLGRRPRHANNSGRNHPDSNHDEHALFRRDVLDRSPAHGPYATRPAGPQAPGTLFVGEHRRAAMSAGIQQNRRPHDDVRRSFDRRYLSDLEPVGGKVTETGSATRKSAVPPNQLAITQTAWLAWPGGRCCARWSPASLRPARIPVVHSVPSHRQSQTTGCALTRKRGQACAGCSASPRTTPPASSALRFPRTR